MVTLSGGVPVVTELVKILLLLRPHLGFYLVSEVNGVLFFFSERIIFYLFERVTGAGTVA